MPDPRSPYGESTKNHLGSWIEQVCVTPLIRTDAAISPVPCASECAPNDKEHRGWANLADSLGRASPRHVKSDLITGLRGEKTLEYCLPDNNPRMAFPDHAVQSAEKTPSLPLSLPAAKGAGDPHARTSSSKRTLFSVPILPGATVTPRGATVTPPHRRKVRSSGR